MEVKQNILELIGRTPLVRINKLNAGLKPTIYAKMENLNPGGSVKDRIGIAMLEKAEREGAIKPGGTVIEATSGNTGIGLALACAVKGYKAIFVVTDKVSFEKINYLRALGSDVIVVSNAVKHDHPDYYINVAKRINSETPNSLFMYQYSNPANPEAHYKTTGPEIWEQTEGKITHFVSGIGTGGTISGVGRFLKEKNKNIQIIGSDPYGSIFKSYVETGEKGESFPYLVEGIGQDCLPENVHFQYIDRVININDKESFHYARLLSKQEGIFVGGSTGTIVAGALKLAEEIDDENALIVFIICDTGERYLTKFHNEMWLREKRLFPETKNVLDDIVNEKKHHKISEVVSVSPKDKVKTAVEAMSSKGFTQIPVIENGESVGSLREAKVMARLLDNPEIMDYEVEKIMGPSFPVLDSKTEINVVKKYLIDSPAVIVTEYGRIIDIITRFDLLGFSKTD